jgi:hypothetical protein
VQWMAEPKTLIASALTRAFEQHCAKVSAN